MRLKLRPREKWVLLEGFKAGQERQLKAAGAEFGPEWLRGWRAAQTIRRNREKGHDRAARVRQTQ